MALILTDEEQALAESVHKFVADRSPHKQNTWLPGSRIPVVSPEAMLTYRPDYVFILPWNLKEEIRQQLAYVREWGAKLVVPIPEVEVF